MLLARLVTVKPANPTGSEPRPAEGPSVSFERILKVLTSLFGRK